MRVNKQNLLETLTKLRPGLAQRDIIEQNTCFCFYTNKIVTFNDNIFVAIPFESGMEGGVRADELYKLLTKISTEEVEISTQNNECRIVSGKVKAGIGLVEVHYPEVTTSANWRELSSGLLDAIKMARFSVSSNMTRPRFTCIHIKGDKVTSSDGYRVTQITLTEPSPFDFLLPGFSSQFLGQYSFTKINVEDNWIHLSNDSELVFSVRQMAGEFFDEEQIEKYANVDGPTLVFPRMTDTLERCRLMANTEVSFETKVELAFEDNKLTCRGQKEVGWIEEELDIEYTGNPFKIFINPDYLTEILGRTTNVVVGEDRCLFTGDNFKHVMVLIDG
jgi:DNA polymerase III sliding clamp (beta) subunit (PCNA family)